MNDRSVQFRSPAEDLSQVARRACAEASRSAPGPLFAAVLEAPAPIPLHAAAAALRAGLHHPLVFYSSADGREAYLGLGAARSFEGAGDHRFRDAAQWWRETVGELPPGSGAPSLPVALGGFAFWPAATAGEHWAAFPEAWWVLPEVLVAERGGRRSLLLCGQTEGGGAAAADLLGELMEALQADDPPPARTPPQPREGMDRRAFTALVAEATAAIAAGRFDKVVLARSVAYGPVGPDDAASALLRLWEQQPGCRAFAASRNGSTFLGASPERLARVAQGVAAVDCLAGSAARGADPLSDERLAADLLASGKDLAEHGYVVRQVADGLRALGLVPQVPQRPAVMRLSGVQHLHTPVRAPLADGIGLLEVAQALCPTPAVGGAPRSPALAWLERHEKLERGWYAGAVGWLDVGGDGELSVAIRSALLSGGLAEVFAGCGVVEGSDPEHEFRETELKLQPMLRALGVVP